MNEYAKSNLKFSLSLDDDENKNEKKEKKAVLKARKELSSFEK